MPRRSGCSIFSVSVVARVAAAACCLHPVNSVRACELRRNSRRWFRRVLCDYALSLPLSLSLAAWSEVARLSVSRWPRPPGDKAPVLPGESPRPGGILPFRLRVQRSEGEGEG